nr:phosphatase PAP2 family protein [uncultured Rhodopila sp.]
MGVALNRRNILTGVLVVAAGSIPFVQAGLFSDTIFVKPSQFDARQILHTPPDPASSTTKAELAELRRIQDTRTPEALAKARADAANQTVFLFKTVLGDGFTADKLPETARFFARVASDESFFADVPKDFWKRLRPTALDPAIQPCAPTGGASYPSGHSTRGYLFGVVLAAAIPEKHDAILDRAADYAQNRVICGAHFPSDVEAGRLVGISLAAVMLAQSTFRQALQAVQAELRSASLTAGN